MEKEETETKNSILVEYINFIFGILSILGILYTMLLFINVLDFIHPIPLIIAFFGFNLFSLIISLMNIYHWKGRKKKLRYKKLNLLGFVISFLIIIVYIICFLSLVIIWKSYKPE